MLRTSAAWQNLPDICPSPTSYHRRFQEWQRERVTEKILTSLTDDLKKRGKDTKIKAAVIRSRLPIAIHLESASQHGITLVEATIASRFVAAKSQPLIEDRVNDSDLLDTKLQEVGTKLIALHRRNRVKLKDPGRTQVETIQTTLED